MVKDLIISTIQTTLHWESISANLNAIAAKIATINKPTDLIKPAEIVQSESLFLLVQNSLTNQKHQIQQKLQVSVKRTKFYRMKNLLLLKNLLLIPFCTFLLFFFGQHFLNNFGGSTTRLSLFCLFLRFCSSLHHLLTTVYRSFWVFFTVHFSL